MAKLTPEDWVQGALRVFAESGIQAVRVEPLAKALGVSKGSFYWHFENREALFTAMLETWERGATLDVIATVDQVSTDPTEKLRALGQIAFRPTNFDRVEANLRIWGASYSPAAKRCRRVDKKRIAYVVALLIECGLDSKTADHRANLLYLVMIGNTSRLNSGEDGIKPDAREALLEMLLS